jgi:CheY-like chemotaxis protein
MRVLYVEDNPANVFLVKRVAKMGNHEIINYVDGMEVLERFKTINPDLVLMDIQINGELNGLDVVKRLRAEGFETPIIAVTAYAMVGDRERCIQAGCTDYMAKPLPIPQLVQLFEHYSQERFRTSELEQLGTSKAEVAQTAAPQPATPPQSVSTVPAAAEAQPAAASETPPAPEPPVMPSPSTAQTERMPTAAIVESIANARQAKETQPPATPEPPSTPEK